VGLEDEKLLDDLASKKGLIAGRRILTAKCVQCHDLRTVLARPRTPKSWRQTVSRMANRSTILNPITEDDQWFVTAYLVAVSPTLQETLKQRRKIEMDVRESQISMESAEIRVETEDTGYDHASAEELFKQTCSQCHSHTQVEQAPPGTKLEAIALVKRMVGNGLEASDSDLTTIIRYLTTTYAGQQPGQGQTPPEQGSSEDMIPIDGMELYSERLCIGCHGPGGDSPSSPFYPVLAGQNKDYLIRQFKDIRSGRRSNGATATMSALVQNVTNQEIATIAGYLSVQKQGD
jgi:cytochrome c